MHIDAAVIVTACRFRVSRSAMGAMLRTSRVARACRAGVRAMGLQVWAARDEIAAACVTSITVPDGLTDVGVRDHVRDRVRLARPGDAKQDLRFVAASQAVAVFISVTTLDTELKKIMEPRTSPPAARLAAIRALSMAGIPTGVLVAPVLPGLTDHEIPAIIAAASGAATKLIPVNPRPSQLSSA